MTEPVFRGPDGIEVRAVQVSGQDSRFRVKRHGWWQWFTDPASGERRDPRTLAELGTLVDLAGLEEAA